MRVVIQRVTKAAVHIENRPTASIASGLMILVGIENEDTDHDIEWLTSKICRLRIFADESGAMNLCVADGNHDILVISQFTLHASTKKGNRPSFIKAARPEVAIPLYEKFIVELQKAFDKPIKTGVFGADMQIELINDGPVTICIDTKNKE